MYTPIGAVMTALRSWRILQHQLFSYTVCRTVDPLGISIWHNAILIGHPYKAQSKIIRVTGMISLLLTSVSSMSKRQHLASESSSTPNLRHTRRTWDQRSNMVTISGPSSRYRVSTWQDVFRHPYYTPKHLLMTVTSLALIDRTKTSAIQES